MARLFIPGPTDVHPDAAAAQALPMIGHRSQEFGEIFARIQPRLKQVFSTDQRVYIATSSGTGFFEGVIRNCAGGRLLVAVCGAFGDRWAQVAESNGIAYDRLDSPWGEPNTANQVEDALETGAYDTLVLVHNETSTGVENPIEEIAQRARRVQPELVILVDAVSSAGGVEIKTDLWGLDVVLTSSQKCFALPPGLSMAAVSDRALRRAESNPHRGWYHDLLAYERYLQRNNTPATPAVSLFRALDLQLERMLEEGLEARFARHQALAEITQSWASDRFDLYAAQGFRSRTATAILNTRSIDVKALNLYLQSFDMSLANGYGPIKDKTFRIGHMGETQIDDLEQLLAHIDDFLQGG